MPRFDTSPEGFINNVISWEGDEESASTSSLCFGIVNPWATDDQNPRQGAVEVTRLFRLSLARGTIEKHRKMMNFILFY